MRETPCQYTKQGRGGIFLVRFNCWYNRVHIFIGIANDWYPYFFAALAAHSF